MQLENIRTEITAFQQDKDAFPENLTELLTDSGNKNALSETLPYKGRYPL